MPTALTFQNDHFSCRLNCMQCEFTNDDGVQCRNRTCNPPFCWLHSRQTWGVKKKEIPSLFAERNFAINDRICPYYGEIIDDDCLETRYPGETQAPYSTPFGENENMDAACYRGIGANARVKCDINGRTLNRNQHNAEIVRIGNELWLVAIKNINIGDEILVFSGVGYECATGYKTTRKKNEGEDPKPCP